MSADRRYIIPGGTQYNGVLASEVVWFHQVFYFPMRRELLVGSLLVAAVTLVYLPVYSYPFVLLDDPGYVTANPWVRSGLTRDGLAYAFSGVTVGNWQPLTVLSHMLDCQLFGAKDQSAGAHHLVSLALHVANMLLLFAALRSMTGAVWRSGFAAALFGLHPLHVESVAWISERKDVLSTLFFMLVLLAYQHYARRPGWLRYATVFVLLALGLMCKPMLVTAPLVLLLLDYWPLGRKLPLWQLVLEKVPLLVLTATSAAITFRVQEVSGAMGMLGGKLTLATRLANAICAYGLYLEKMFWPLPLAAVYPYATHKLVDVLIIGAALAAMSVAVCRMAGIKPYLPVGWWWYVVTLLPVIGLVQVGVQSLADRYTYIPLIGLFIIATWGGAELTEGLSAAGKSVAVAGAGLLLAVCAWLTSQQLVTWSSSELLFRRAVAAAPDNGFARNALGQYYWQQGRLDKAEEQFEAVVKMESDQSLRVEGGFEPAHVNLGLLLAVQHQPRAALAQFDKAIELQPQAPAPRRHEAWLLATYPDESHPSEKVRDGDKAVRLAMEALKLSNRKPAELWDTLAVARAETGDFAGAIEAEEKAIDEARRTRADDLLPELEGRLKLFKAHEPYHAEPRRPLR